MNDAEKLEKLKILLLQEDRDFANQIFEKLSYLESEISEETLLSKRVDPIIDKKLATYTVDIPEKLGPSITEALSEQIKNSQDQVVEALFPIIGKMIKKYIQQEIKILSDNINNQVQKNFSVKALKRKIKSFFTGISEQEIVLSEQNHPKIQQLFIIEKGSGIILASHSKTETIDQDMIAGMLTAIKSFVEDAFQAGNQNLETIEYELYTIQIQNFSNYYIAVVVSGSFNNNFKSTLEDKLMTFANLHIKNNTDNKTYINQQLVTFFDHE